MEDVVISSQFWLGRRVFLTGHTGFKGAWLTLMLDRLSAVVTGYSLAPASETSAFEVFAVADLLRDRRGDVCDLPALEAAMGQARPEIVIHLAAQSLVRQGYADPIETYRTNVLGTANVLESARRLPSVRLVIVVTTDKCYENTEAEAGYRETDRLGGSDPYSTSKACAELVSASFRQSFVSDGQPIIVTVRSGNVIGGGDFAADRIIPDAFRAFGAGKELAVRNPRSVRPWQHVLEPLRGYLLLAEKVLSGDGSSSAYNFGPGPDGEQEVRVLLDRFATEWGETATWRHDPGPHPEETKLLRLDTTRAQDELGWQPILTFDDTVRWTAEWYRAFANGEDIAALTREQADRYLGQCVRLVPPLRSGGTTPIRTAPPGTMSGSSPNPDVLRARIMGLVAEYHAVAHQRSPFDAEKPSVPVSGRVYDASDMQMLVESALDFWLTTGRFNDAFERRLADRIGARHAMTVNSGSSANLVAFSALTSPRLKARQLRPGDEVITCATGFPTTVNPVLQTGMVPVFVDVDLPTYNIDVSQIEAAITSRTRAIMVAHTLGNPFDVLAVREICDRHDLFLIEDCCDALGATVGGRHVGTFGDVGTLSFYPAHHITMGEGGAVFTSDNHLRKIMESFRDWGRDCYCDPGCDNTCNKRFGWTLGDLPKGYDHKYIYAHLGYNLKITDMQAAVGLAQLDHLDGFIQARMTNFARLRSGLAGLEDVFILPEATPGTEPSWFGFPLTVRPGAHVSRDELAIHLNGRGIGTRLLFGGNLVRQPYMKGRNYRVAGDLSNADLVVGSTLWIGVYPGLGEHEIQHVLDTITRFVRAPLRMTG